MPTVDGNVYLGATEQDPVTLQLLEEDGVTPIPLTGATEIQVRMRNANLHSETKFFDDNKITVISEALGKIQISQAADDFPVEKRWEYYVRFLNSDSKRIRVPKQTPGGLWHYAWEIGPSY